MPAWLHPVALAGLGFGLPCAAAVTVDLFRRPQRMATMHCGAGRTLGDILAETAVFLGGFTLFGSAFGAELAGDFALAYLLGLVFQYFAIVPMRGLPPGRGIVEAAKADTPSLLAFEVGLFGWMALRRFVLFDPPLRPDQAADWFMMQVGMAVGFFTSYPVNAWLIRRGIKGAIWNTCPPPCAPASRNACAATRSA